MEKHVNREPGTVRANSFLSGTELTLNDATGEDFWSYALGNLMVNTSRGPFGEWLVAKLLDIDLDYAQAWDEYDLEFSAPSGKEVKKVKLEVKCAALWQEWMEDFEPVDVLAAKVKFSNLKGAKWDDRMGKRTKERDYMADLYVFCLHNHPRPEGWDAFDLDQWEFYILRKLDLKNTGHDSKKLTPLKEMAHKLSKRFERFEIPAVVKAAKLKDVVIKLSYKLDEE